MRRAHATGQLFGGLRNIERDADGDAVMCVHLLGRTCGPDRGAGLEASVERIVRYEAEGKKKRKVMGLSTYRRSLELKESLVATSRLQCSNQCDAELAAQSLGTIPQLKTVWSVDTCPKYKLIADKFNKDSGMIMDKWEIKSGRACLLDRLRTRRSAGTAAQTQPEMLILVQTLFRAQTCKLRTTMGHRGNNSASDATALRWAILLRNRFYQYVHQVFPKLQDLVAVYGTLKWYNVMYGMDIIGRLSGQGALSDDDEHEGAISRAIRLALRASAD